jgi:hypothetical protein
LAVLNAFQRRNLETEMVRDGYYSERKYLRQKKKTLVLLENVVNIHY